MNRYVLQKDGVTVYDSGAEVIQPPVDKPPNPTPTPTPTPPTQTGATVLPVKPYQWVNRVAGAAVQNVGSGDLKQAANTIQPYSVALSDIMQGTVSMVALYGNSQNLEFCISATPGDMIAVDGFSPAARAQSGNDGIRFASEASFKDQNGKFLPPPSPAEETLRNSGLKLLPRNMPHTVYINVWAKGPANYTIWNQPVG